MKSSDKKRLTVREITVFAMLGALLLGGKMVFEAVPNVHPLTMLVMVYTLTYRWKAFFPLLVYLVMDAARWGPLTMVPYFYIFPLVICATMAIPQKLSPLPMQIVCTAVCTFFGIAFGTLYAPWQALVFMKTLEPSKIIAWIIAGLPYDLLHAAGNFAASFLILPLTALLKKLDSKK